MKFRSKNKISPEFNMSSMTDLIFLLLIFFMLTSNLVTPMAVPVSLPSTKPQQTVVEIQNVGITISKDLQYYVNDKKVPFAQLETVLTKEFKGEKYKAGDSRVPVAVLNIDKSVPVEHLVKVAGIVNSLGAKVSLATEPDDKK